LEARQEERRGGRPQTEEADLEVGLSGTTWQADLKKIGY
jgi:hypothetical protein